jgi:hypothetical protein
MLGKDAKMIAEHAARATEEAQREKQDAIIADVEDKRLQAIAADGVRPTTDVQAQMGHIMRGDEVRNKLRKLNSNFHFEVAISDPTRVGIYIRDGVSNMDTASHKGLLYLMGMEKDLCPEFSVRFTKEERYWNTEKDKEDTRESFAGELRGWRTVISRLLRKGLFMHADMLREFPDTDRSKNWRQLMN